MLMLFSPSGVRCGCVGSFSPPPFSKVGVVLKGLLSLPLLTLASGEEVNRDDDGCLRLWVMTYSAW